MEDLRIVIADNSEEDLKRLKEVLIRIGHNVVASAKDGVTALKFVRSYEPDLVIFNANLPGMSGVEAAKIIDEESLAAVVLMSTYYDQDMIDKAKDAGALGYMIKPVEENDILANLYLAMATYDKIKALQGQLIQLKGTLATRKTLERAKGLLMEHLGITEEEAFKRIQRQSMEKRKSMKEISESIIIAYEI